MSANAIQTREVSASGLRFEVAVAGEPTAPLVLLLHGFPQTSHTWRRELPALADAGYFAVAPNQRGYSPGARPAAVDQYTLEQLTADALGIADGFAAPRFHLVGHDWGGQLAWTIAALHPERVATLTVLSRPHPSAFARALREDAAQSERSRHHRAFLDPSTATRLLDDGARRLRRTLQDQGVPEPDVDAYLSCLGDPAALDAALNWYRAAQPRAAAVSSTSDSHAPASALARELPAITVPTLYVWGDADATVGRAAAEATTSYVHGPNRFEVIPGAGHFLTDQVGEHVTRLLLEHLAQHAATVG
jgi:pimeloyl-ACP methyl ester carboxylesterase